MLLLVPLSPAGCCFVVSVGEAGQVRPGQGTSVSETETGKRELDQEEGPGHLRRRGGLRGPRNRLLSPDLWRPTKLVLKRQPPYGQR